MTNAMIREIVLDTETTGLSPRDGHRVVEIGAVELINHMPTGQSFHVYCDPERDMPREAEAVHGLSNAFLKGKPRFAAEAKAFLDFIGGSLLIIHNASFDTAFLNWELQAAGHPALDPARVLDTLALAKQKFPMGPNSLDALCKRFGIDNSRRIKHGALLDSELLAEVYLELIGGRQTALGLAAPGKSRTGPQHTTRASTRQRPSPLPPRLTETERAAHAALVQMLGEKSLWPKPGDGT
jgi:DNA polymerase III subunit epsilon